MANHATLRQFLTKTQINDQVFTLCACACRRMNMLRCGSNGPKACVVSLIIKSKLSVKYNNIKKRSEEDKIIFAFVSDYFYCYRFYFFNYLYRFRLGLKIEKTRKQFQKIEDYHFRFHPYVAAPDPRLPASLGGVGVCRLNAPLRTCPLR